MNNETVVPQSFDAPTNGDGNRPSIWRWRYLFFGALALIVTLFILFLVSARALVIRTNAEDADISLVGGATLQLSENRFLLLKGDYQLEIKALGYYPQSHSLAVDADTLSTLDYQLAPLPGRIRASFGMDEEVWGIARLNGMGMGPAREFLFKDLEPDTYELRADAYLYKESVQKIEVLGREITQEIEFALEPNWGYLNYELDLADAEFFANGNKLDSTEQPIRIEAGESELKIELHGYKPYVRQLSLSEQETFELGKIELLPVDSQVEVITQPAGASVTVNGNFAGRTPVTLDLLPDVEHELKLFKAGYVPQERRLKVARDARETATYRLKADLVNVSISVLPRHATVKVDGRLVGQGSLDIPLSSIKHRILVEADGYASQRLNFLPLKGSQQLLQVQLLTEEEQIWSKIPTSYGTKAGQTMRLFRDTGLVSLGSSRREAGRRANEVAWQANLTRPFYVSTTEVTNEQYRLYDSEHSSGHFQSYGLDSPKQPAVNLSWQKAALYCNWLSEQSGFSPFYQTTKGFVSGVNQDATGYRLLTEAEWTFITKSTSAGTSQKYSWGNDDTPPDSVGNFADQSISLEIKFVLADFKDGFAVSAPVASFKPNSWGIYDAGGNVNEWLHDWYQPVPYDSNSPVVDPLGPEDGEFHVIRGASWARGYLPQLRVAYRDYDSKGRNDLGFRIARYAR